MALRFPVAPGSVIIPLDVDDLAVALCVGTDLANTVKLNDFRINFNAFLQTAGVAFDTAEPWYTKDMVQLLAELVLFTDLSTLVPQVVTAIFVQTIIDFGHDGLVTIAWLLCLRLFYGNGRYEFTEEGQWVTGAVVQSYARCTEYLLSDQAGDLQLIDLVRDLA